MFDFTLSWHCIFISHSDWFYMYKYSFVRIIVRIPSRFSNTKIYQDYKPNTRSDELQKQDAEVAVGVLSTSHINESASPASPQSDQTDLI